MKIEPKQVTALEYEGVLYESMDKLKDYLAEGIIWKSYNSSEWYSNPKETYTKLKEVYENDD